MEQIFLLVKLYQSNLQEAETTVFDFLSRYGEDDRFLLWEYVGVETRVWIWIGVKDTSWSWSYVELWWNPMEIGSKFASS